MNQDDKVRTTLKIYFNTIEAWNTAKRAIPKAERIMLTAQREAARVLKAAGSTRALFEGYEYALHYPDGNEHAPTVSVAKFDGIVL